MRRRSALSCGSCLPGKARSEPGADDPIGVLIYSFLLCGSPTSVKASAGWTKLQGSLVDFNELRVCMPAELAEIAGDTSDLCSGFERPRLRASLRDIYNREHGVHLASPDGQERSGPDLSCRSMDSRNKRQCAPRVRIVIQCDCM